MVRRKSNKGRNKFNRTHKRVRSNLVTTQSKSPKNYTKHAIILRVPDTFSLINNTEESLNFLNEVYKTIGNASVYRVNLDFGFVTELTIDALLYLIAQMLKQTGLADCELFGNRPRDVNTQQLFDESGFFDYFALDKKNKKEEINKDTELIKIKAGTQADPEIMSQFADFAMEKLQLELKDRSIIYETLVEITSNSDEHAGITDERPHWFAFARHDAETHSIVFSVLDIGHGIAKTVRRNWKDWINSNDFTIIKSAFEGAFRTQTNEGKRGKGIPDIYNFSQQGIIKSMHLVSGKAYIDLTDLSKESLLEGTLDGTLYSWKVCNADQDSH